MQDKPSFLEVPPEKLRWRCDPADFCFDTTADLAPLEGIIGQQRAQRALEIGLEIAATGYNIYVCGTRGTGRLTAVQRLLSSRQAVASPPPDMCYVFAFKTPEQPRLLVLPQGQGKALKKVMDSLLAALKQEIPALLASAQVQQRKDQIQQQTRQREQRLVAQCELRLTPDLGLLWHEVDQSLGPELAARLDNRLTPFAELERRLESGHFSLEQYRTLHARRAQLSPYVQTMLATLKRLRQEADDAVHTLERALVRPLVQQAVAQAASTFPQADVQQYLQEVEEALYEDWERFLENLQTAERDTLPMHPQPAGYEEDPFHEYQINIIVDNTETQGAPVIFETAPTYKNLFGLIEPTVEYGGGWRSDFMGIRAGAIHRAHGGYLVFDALEALTEPLVWSTLKRTLRFGRSEIQTFDHLSLVPSTALKPEPIPCDVKVIMLGDEDLYYALLEEDINFKRLFKIKADFDTILPREAETVRQYAAFLSRLCHTEHLRHCDRYAVAALIEWGVRLAGRQTKLSARLDIIADIVRESHYWAGKAGATTIGRAAVEQALQERLLRINLIEEKLRELIEEGILLMTTSGMIVGQVNGLAVYELEEDYAFGCPIRITAETSIGDTGVVNIEREVDLGDATHNKGVLILSGYLRHVYAQDKPLVLSASLCIEQSYEGIAGDSASAAEIYALLSSLANLPVDQGIAVTGSVNQKGQLQPISGINEKIEGFFDVCRLQGLTGTQGVILPYQNVDDLMLREDLVAAVASGQFHLYPIATIDEGLPILTGYPAGKRSGTAWYPETAVNARVDAQLRRYATQWHVFQHGDPLPQSSTERGSM
ncbi:MAG: AAA family ATPase [Candidatus Tectimicrobiota bacterium]